jgi:hypothetical protein
MLSGGNQLFDTAGEEFGHRFDDDSLRESGIERTTATIRQRSLGARLVA